MIDWIAARGLINADTEVDVLIEFEEFFFDEEFFSLLDKKKELEKILRISYR
jgi:predicted nucleotidyltransferase